MNECGRWVCLKGYGYGMENRLGISCHIEWVVGRGMSV